MCNVVLDICMTGCGQVTQVTAIPTWSEVRFTGLQIVSTLHSVNPYVVLYHPWPAMASRSLNWFNRPQPLKDVALSLQSCAQQEKIFVDIQYSATAFSTPGSIQRNLIPAHGFLRFRVPYSPGAVILNGPRFIADKGQLQTVWEFGIGIYIKVGDRISCHPRVKTGKILTQFHYGKSSQSAGEKNSHPKTSILLHCALSMSN